MQSHAQKLHQVLLSSLGGIEPLDAIELTEGLEYQHHNYVYKSIILIVILQINFKLFGVVLAINEFGL